LAHPARSAHGRFLVHSALTGPIGQGRQRVQGPPFLPIRKGGDTSTAPPFEGIGNGRSLFSAAHPKIRNVDGGALVSRAAFRVFSRQHLGSSVVIARASFSKIWAGGRRHQRRTVSTLSPMVAAISMAFGPAAASRTTRARQTTFFCVALSDATLHRPRSVSLTEVPSSSSAQTRRSSRFCDSCVRNRTLAFGNRHNDYHPLTRPRG
jgi:hypothetical protein